MGGCCFRIYGYGYCTLRAFIRSENGVLAARSTEKEVLKCMEETPYEATCIRSPRPPEVPTPLIPAVPEAPT